MKTLTPPKAIIFDVDGVLLDWASTFLLWLKVSKGVSPAIDPEDQLDYDLSKSLFPCVSEDVVDGWIGEFNRSDRYAYLPIMDGAISEMISIRQKFPGWKLVAVTAPGSHPLAVRGRANNIANLFPEIEKLHILPIGATKFHVFCQYPAGSFVIDDCPRHLADAEEAGHIPVAFDSPYNRTHKRYARLFSWFGATDQLLKLSLLSNYSKVA